jgi:hypothetical protein
MTKKIFFSILVGVLLSATSSFAALSPLGVAIIPPVQFPPGDFSITGARISLLWGQHRDVYGVDLGLLGNITEQDFVGVGVSGLFNITKGTTYVTGLQAAGFGNFNNQKTNVYGLQLAAIMNYNKAESSVYGVQLAAANIADHTDIYGFQMGVYNSAKAVYGVQFGLVNMTNNLHGVQIGLVNFNSAGPFKVSPILNVGF